MLAPECYAIYQHRLKCKTIYQNIKAFKINKTIKALMFQNLIGNPTH